MSNSKYRLMFILSGALMVFGLGGGVAQAHVLKQDNGIAAVLHIPPDDSPRAAEPTVLDIDFGDGQDRFNLNDCICGVQVLSQGRVIQQVGIKPAMAGSTLTSVTSVRFPSVGIYNLIVFGKSKDNAFPSFRLNYLERIATSAQPKTSKTSAAIIDIAVVCIAAIIIISMTIHSRSGQDKRRH